MSDLKNREGFDYSRSHTIAHMRAGGYQNVEIELFLVEVGDGPDRDNLVDQYIESLSEGDREAARLRLNPVK